MSPDLIHHLWANIEAYLIRVNQFFTPKGCIYLAAFFLVLLIVLKIQPKKPTRVKIKNLPQTTPPIQNVDLIAGDDVITTQLDLAKAYIEMGENNLAKDILSYVSVQGNQLQKKQAEKLTVGL